MTCERRGSETQRGCLCAASPYNGTIAVPDEGIEQSGAGAEPGAGRSEPTSVVAPVLGPGTSPLRLAVDATDRARTLAAARRALLGLGEGVVRLGRYRLGPLLGRGGQGAVYRAHDKQLGRDVAIKTVRRSTRDATAILRREARVLAHLRHPNIVAVYDVAELSRDPPAPDGGGSSLCVVMELVEGINARRWIDGDAPGAMASSGRGSEVLRVFRQAALGLAEAHRHGLVHGDFKPENLLLGVDGRVKVADFGLARATSDSEGTPGGHATVTSLADGTTRSRHGGTPTYMAPELSSVSRPTPVSDQFAWCLSLLEALTRSSPPSARRWDLEPADLSRRERTQVDAVLTRGLAADPRDRFVDLETLLEALDRRGPRGATLAVLSLGVAAVGSVVAWSPASASSCADALTLEGVWDARVRGGVRASVARHAPEHATDHLHAIEGALDRFAADFHGAVTEACSSPGKPAMRARACLTDQRRHTGATTSLLLEPAQEAVMHGRGQIEWLPDPRACLGDGGQAKLDALPGGPEVRRAIARARAAAANREVAEAQRAADAAVSLAQSTGASALVGAARHARGQLWYARRSPTRALRDLERAFELSVEAGADAQAAAIGADLLVARARSMPGTEFEHWERHVDAAVRRASADALRGRLQAARGIWAFNAGQPDVAVESLSAAVDRLPPDDALTVVARLSLAGALAYRGELSQAEAEFTAGMEAAERRYLPADPELVMVFANVSNFYAQLRRPGEARRLAERAVAHAELGGSSSTEPLRKSLLNLGVAQVLAGELDRARISLGRAADLSPPGARDPLTAKIAFNRVALYEELDEIDRALAEAPAVLRQLEAALGPHHRMTVQAQPILPRCLRRAGRLDEALVAARQARQSALAAFGPDDPATAFASMELAEVHSQRGEHDDALATIRRAVEIYERAGAQIPAAQARYGLGTFLHAAGRERAGATQVRSAMATLRELDPESAIVERAATWLAEHPTP